MRLRNKDGPRGKVSFVLGNTNQNMSPGRDVSPSPGEGGTVNQHRVRGREVNERGRRTRW